MLPVADGLLTTEEVSAAGMPSVPGKDWLAVAADAEGPPVSVGMLPCSAAVDMMSTLPLAPGATGVRTPVSVETGHTVVVTGITEVESIVLLAGQFLTLGGHFTTVYVAVESMLC